MDRCQIALIFGMDVLGIPICVKNYRQICDAVYQAKQMGVHLTSERIEFNKKNGHAYSPMSHEYGGCPSCNLLTEVDEIEIASGLEKEEVSGWELDAKSIDVLLRLKTLNS